MNAVGSYVYSINSNVTVHAISSMVLMVVHEIMETMESFTIKMKILEN